MTRLRTGIGALLPGVCVLLLGAPAVTRAAGTGPVPLHATVVWTRADRVYLAAADSVALDAGMILSFEYRGREVAAGEVTAVSNGELIAARLTTGSLLKIRKLDRVRVTAMRAPIRRVSLLRIGYPSASRPSLLFACDSMTLHAAGPIASYGAANRGVRTYQLVRVYRMDEVDRDSWPDTILIRLFDEAADEEIALERGELDAAVFWPGEASTHIREAMQWQGEAKGTRWRGVVEAVAAGPTSVGAGATADSLPRAPLDAMNEGLFRGDLTPCVHGPPAAAPSPSVWPRFEVDHDCPGWQVLEQYLNRLRNSPGAPPARGTVRVAYLDKPVRGPVAPPCLFTLGCPVMSQPALHTYLKELGLGALVNLFDCVPTGQRR